MSDTTWFSVDIEADGPYPPTYSMLSIGVVKVDKELKTTFYRELRPIGTWVDLEAMAVNGLDRDKLLKEGSAPRDALHDLADWLAENTNGRPVMVSDNPLFDGQFINYYFHYWFGENPFGHSAKRIGDMWLGIKSFSNHRNDYIYIKDWHELIDTPHDHNALNDAIGNAEAILEMQNRYGLKVPGL
jgi:DNA polymerase III epsilon subunit-like protein